MISRKYVAAAVAAVGLAAAGAVIGADAPQTRGCGSEQHASADHGGAQGMQHMRDMHASMGGMHKHTQHGEVQPDSTDSKKAEGEEHKH